LVRARRRWLLASDESAENFWPSFTDLISTVSMILFVLVLLAYIQNLISGKKLAQFRIQLDATARRLALSQRQISDAQSKLRLLEADLRKTSAEIEAAQLRLGASEEQVERQRAVIDESNQELTSLRSKLQGIAVLRVGVLDRVKRSIEGQLGPTGATRAPPVIIGDNGNIVISEKLVFEYDSHAIREQGKPLLDTLSRAFANVLADASVRENIDVILVQGHTDERGTSSYNRELSARRANAVLNYMFETNKTLERSYGSFFAASAYSEFRPLNPARTEAAFEQNRRIEISVVLKDATIRSTIDEYMKNAKPLPGPEKAAPLP
jgi:chemotaxis protein MotB